MTSRHDAHTFLTGATNFAERCDAWLVQFGAEAQSGWCRSQILQQSTELRNLRDALRWGPSIGLYGESQCGKSNLVSRFGKNLGAPCTPTGSLLLNDPTALELRSSRPWHTEGVPGIEFASWVDPAAGKEATGIVCRFTRTKPEGAIAGHFLVELMSQAELVSSLALGYDAEIREHGADKRKERLEKTLKKLRVSPKEPDPENIMGQLIEAWRFLSQEHVLGRSSLISDLDNGEEGWDEFARDCFRNGERPRFARGSDASDLDEFVGLLWDSLRPLTKLWRRVTNEQRKLEFARSLWVPVEAVCKDKPRGGERMPLVAVDWIHKVFDEGGYSCNVRRKVSGGGMTTSSLAQSIIVALAREIVFPVGDESCAEDSVLDVLDYPGARNEERNRDLSLPDMAPEVEREGATQALLRGKINRLFVSAVDYQDSTALCLVLSGSGGNPAAGKPIVRALRAWFEREGWRPGGAMRSAGAFPELDGGVAQERREPPFVVAVSKSDLVWGSGAQSFVAKIGQLKEKYCEGLDWMEQWWEGQPFNRIYWVHNPDAVGAKKPGDWDASHRESTIQRCLEMGEFNKHVGEPRKRLEALVGTPEKPPTDVADLFNDLRGQISPDRRVRKLIDRALDKVEKLAAAVNSSYIGDQDHKRTEEERALALKHVAALKKALSKDASVSHFLRALDMPASAMERAYQRAAHQASRDNEGNDRCDFDSFYNELCAMFTERFDKALRAESTWLRELGAGAGADNSNTVLAQIQARFSKMPNAPWFREAMENALAPMIEAFDSANLPIQALGSIGSAVWNRNMVWLGSVPEAPMYPAESPPRLRLRNAASEAILLHWKGRLSEVYATIDDPEKKTARHNLALGIVRRELSAAVGAFRAQLEQGSRATEPEWNSIRARLENLQKELAESRAEPSVQGGA